jgi:hypothetical protein
MVKCIRVSVDGIGPSFIEPKATANNIDIDALFDGAEVGDKYHFELVEMTQEAIDSLTEFTGF